MVNFIMFTKIKLAYGFLSNMAPSPISYSGEHYRTGEHLFQSLRYENHPEIQATIRSSHSPMRAKMIAKTATNLSQIKLVAEDDLARMRTVLAVKFEQNDNLQKLLIATGDAILVEDVGARRNRGSAQFWGAYIDNTGVLVGQNWLGRLLMETRNKICGDKK